jgi:sulfur relay (sulfurtransferase) complex TusBCD TusD component (DsrE family)
MTNYIFIETRDPFESRDTQFIEQTAKVLKQRGHAVTVFLVQNGVFASRRNARESYLPRLVDAGVNVQVDDFSLCERGIQTAELQPGVQPSSIETLVDALLQENTKAIWH